MKETACASGVELLMDYLEGVVPADVRVALEAHVAGCPKCVAFIASYREVPRILRDVTAPTLPAQVELSLRAFLRAQRRERRGDA
jgi:anti-sigma factor RsiW